LYDTQKLHPAQTWFQGFRLVKLFVCDRAWHSYYITEFRKVGTFY